MLNRTAKKFALSELHAGMVMAELLTTEDGKVILNSGTVLTDNLLELLRRWGVDKIAVYLEQQTEEYVEKDLPWSFDRAAFITHYRDTVELVRTAFKSISLFGQVPVARMQELANDKIDPLIEAPGVLNYLLMVRHTHDYTFEHSVNVAIISGIIGKWTGMHGQPLRDLIFAGLMHDIGKSQIPAEILNKPGKLTPEEMDVMRLHTSKGYYLLKELPKLPQVVMWAVLQHHERLDGSGYPLHLPAKSIHPVARIVSIADFYDAMTSDRVYRRRATPYQVMDELYTQMFAQLDTDICSTFLRHIQDYFTGCLVMLSDGRQAEIVRPGCFPTGRPLVRTSDGQFINLEQRWDINIYGLISA